MTLVWCGIACAAGWLAREAWGLFAGREARAWAAGHRAGGREHAAGLDARRRQAMIDWGIIAATDGPGRTERGGAS